MGVRLTAAVKRALACIAVTCSLASLTAQADLGTSTTGRSRVALYGLSGSKTDSALAAVLSTVADSVELSLDVLQRYDVARLPSADPATDLDRVRVYCEANRIDQAILGSGAVRTAGGYDFRLVVYDRRKDSITIDRRGSSSGALDMFDATDSLVASLLDGLSGTHLLFGSLSVDTDPQGATVSINDKDVGQSPMSLRGLPVGALRLAARAPGHEDAGSMVTIADGETSNATLKLERSTGTLSVQMPADAQLTVSSAEIGQKTLAGPGSMNLPTGDYQLSASSAGLATVNGQITVGRNAAESWLPWTKGYLDIRVTPVGATVAVDGMARGEAPLVVEVDPGTLHRVQVNKDRYEAYVADLSSEAGEKTLISPELAALPGSVRVTTSIPGASVRLDDGNWATTPFVFEEVPAGSHTLTIGNVLNGDGVFTAGSPFQVVVSPAETTEIVKEMVRGRGRLVIEDAPDGSAVQIDGKNADSAQALTAGIELPAGKVSVTVTSPVSQKWTGMVYLQPNAVERTSVYALLWEIPTLSTPPGADARVWAGMLPTWKAVDFSPFKDQPGTHISSGYVGKDDRFLYVRFLFSDGTPSRKLSSDFPQVLSYTIFIYTLHNRTDEIHIRADFARMADASNFGVWDPQSRRWTDLGASQVDYSIGQSSMQFRIPLSAIKPYAAGTSQIALIVADQDSQGQWRRHIQTDNRLVSLDF